LFEFGDSPIDDIDVVFKEGDKLIAQTEVSLSIDSAVAAVHLGFDSDLKTIKASTESGLLLRDFPKGTGGPNQGRGSKSHCTLGNQAKVAAIGDLSY